MYNFMDFSSSSSSSMSSSSSSSSPTEGGPVKLCQATLEEIGRQGRVQVPSYDRSKLNPGIVHFGVSNFFRAHFCSFLEDLFNQPGQKKRAIRDWGIVGVSVTPSGVKKGHALRDQDYLTTVIEQTESETHARVVGPMIDYMTPQEDGPEAIVDLLCQPEVRIVSLTITKGNYFIDPKLNKFVDKHPDIQKELDAYEHGTAPPTAFGYIVAALARRRETGLEPFTVLSCDNLLHNGVAARESVVGLARLIEPDSDLGDWIHDAVAFPNAMVDRITPATGDAERQRCAEELGVDDSSPVFSERFRQWIVEDKFTMGRPALERVGVKFIDDVTPYENLKIRILNGGHMTLAHLGPLLGIQHVHEFLRHPVASRFWHRVQRESIVPAVRCGPRGEDPGAYYQLIGERFANPKVRDGIQRLSDMGTTRLTNFINPTIKRCFEFGVPIDGLALVHALWATYCCGERANGEPIPDAGKSDKDWGRLNEAARRARAEQKPAIWLRALPEVYPKEWAGQGAQFRTKFVTYLRAIWRDGVEKAVFNYAQRPEQRPVAEQQEQQPAQQAQPQQAPVAKARNASVLRSNSRVNVEKMVQKQLRELELDEQEDGENTSGPGKKGRWERRRGSGLENQQEAGQV